MLGAIFLAVACVVVTWFHNRLRYLRYKEYAHLPQHPPNPFLGHLKVFGEFMKRGIPDRHPDEIFEEMWVALDRPPIMLVDLRPISSPMVLIPTHEIAEQISKPSKLFPLSTPKSPTWHHMIPLIGDTSILGKEGLDWKDWRKTYNKGFTTQHLWTLMPLVIEKMTPFLRYLEEFATSGQVFTLEKLVSNLTFDIIGASIMEVDFNAQQFDPKNQSSIIRDFAELLRTYSDDKNNFPWWLVPYTALKRQILSHRIDSLIRNIVKEKHDEAKKPTNQSRNILALSFQGIDSLTPLLLKETSNQIRTFLFAGHDSSSSTIQWIIYELSRTPKALKAVREELDEVIGTDIDPTAICAKLEREGEQLLPKLRYVNAVIKETLRLHPPASTVRMTPKGSGFTIHATSGEEYCLDGTIMYACQSIIHRDPVVYGDTADHWTPERLLNGSTYPPSACRPFERGPRNRIGLDLANLETRIILAVVARKYDFVKVGLGASILDDKGRPSLNTLGQHKTSSSLYNTRRMTAKPVDGTIMRVKIAS